LRWVISAVVGSMEYRMRLSPLTPSRVPAHGELGGAMARSAMLCTAPAAVWNCPMTVACAVAGLIVTRLLGLLGLPLPVAPNSVPGVAVLVESCCASPVMDSGRPPVVTTGPIEVEAPVAGLV